MNLAKGFYKRQVTEQTFNFCYNKAIHNAESLQIGRSVLPRYKRLPKRLDQGAKPHQFEAPKDYFHQQYFEACDLLLGELICYLESWMIGLTNKVYCHLSWLWKTLLNSANGLNYEKNWQFLKNFATKKTLILVNSNVILHFWLTRSS